MMEDEDSLMHTEEHQIASCRQVNEINRFSTVQLHTSSKCHSKTEHQSKSIQLQNTLRKPIKIKLFERDSEKTRVMCLEFPLDGVPNILSCGLEDEPTSTGNMVTQPMITRGLALSKFKMLRNFFSNYQEEKKRSTAHDMNMLGLRIKRIDYSSNTRKTFYKQDSRRPANRPRGNSGNFATKQESGLCGIIGENFKFRSSMAIDVEPCSSELTTPFAHNKSEMSCSRVISSQVDRRDSILSNSRTKYSPNKTSPKKLFKFQSVQHPNKIYDGRIESYQQFVFSVRFTHNVFTPQFDADNPQMLKCDVRYKMWIGPGNNSLLIKSLIKRRWWWQIAEDKNDLSFMWTQLKDNGFFGKQKSSKTQASYRQLVQKSNFEDAEDSKASRTILKERVRHHPPEDHLKKMMSSNDMAIYRKALAKRTAKKNKKVTLSNFKELLTKPLLSVQPDTQNLMHNHLENNFFLGNKKAMFHNLKQYYELCEDNVFNYLPLTFHIKDGIKDMQYKRFVHYYRRRANYIKKQELLENGDSDDQRIKKKTMRNIWIVKPGELSNRGNGITVVDQLYEINNILTKKDAHFNGTPKTYIVQLYLDRPMLYNRRKFDIRHYMMISNLYGVTRGYWYTEGYIRTAGYQFDIHNFQREVHLTNDAVQKYCENYGRFQPANKLSYSEFQRYLNATYPKKKYSFAKQIMPKMKEIATDAVRSVYLKLSPDSLEHNFEVFGLDFMIDENFKVWLIEINTNPCLQLCCPLLSRLIPVMVEQSLRLTVDVVFPPPAHYTNNQKHLVPDMNLANIKYELIFDSLIDGDEIKNLYKNVKVSRLMDQIGEISDDEEYADNGTEIKIQDI